MYELKPYSQRICQRTYSLIIFDQTETAEQAREVVDAARFAPHSDRSFPPFAQKDGLTDESPEGSSLLDVWSTNAALVRQIESADGASCSLSFELKPLRRAL